MPKISDMFSIHSSLKLTAILLAAVVATGCISAKSRPPTEAAPAAPAEPAAPVPSTPVVVEPPSADDSATDSLTSWIVAKGEHLWGISAVEEVYNLPEQWPLLYKSNLDQIEDADLIYPGQVLQIPRDVTQSEINAAVHHAQNRGAWALGPVELSDKEYLKNSY